MTGQQAAQSAAALQGAQWAAPPSVTPVPGWKPSMYFGEWKKAVGRTGGGLGMDYVQFCRGMPPNIRKHAIESILRQTMPRVYRFDNGDAACDAMDNDLYAMWEYATRFFDEFWEEFCAQFWQDAVGPEWDKLRPRS